MTTKDPREVRRKELQREILSLIRRIRKGEEKLERLRQKLRDLDEEER